MKRDQIVTLKYKVKVVSGSLKIRLGKNFTSEKDAIFIKEFYNDSEGEFNFHPKYRAYTLRLEGDKTEGSCDITLETSKSDLLRE
ncbi:hypothetical protein [Alkalihalobacterium chitinilyticum]|nr:hypothetical protein [Alkalihalobacterium chitinilyticum]